jgi:2,3,4,5-tetrahydropyridine-2-carboxylate N-succinyltransferase
LNFGAKVQRFEILANFGKQKSREFINMTNLKQIIESAWDDREFLKQPATREAICEVINQLDLGSLRVASLEEGKWVTHEWIKKAVILYFPIRKMELTDIGPFQFYDKIPLKSNWDKLGVRVVPHAIARYGSYIAEGVVMMPSYVNIGAHIDTGTMIDTWATVGSCAQIGKHCHLSGGVGIGGVLEPVQAAPVIIEDHCFLGSRSIVVEGVHVGREAVLGANVVLTGSTRIIDVSGSAPVEYKGEVPPRSVVIPGTLPKTFPAGVYQVPCALIIGQRKASTDLKTSLNQALREFDVPV